MRLQSRDKRSFSSSTARLRGAIYLYLLISDTTMIIAEIRGRGRKSVGVLCDELLVLKRLSIDIDSFSPLQQGSVS